MTMEGSLKKMLNKPIPKRKLEKIKMIIFDSDGVLLSRGTKIREWEIGNKYKLEIETNRISDSLAAKINRLKKKFIICISTGRSLIYLQTMYSKIAGGDVIFQAENGNLLLKDGLISQYFFYNKSYFNKLAKIRNKICLLPILGFEPKQFILTIHAKNEIKEIYDIVKKYDPREEGCKLCGMVRHLTFKEKEFQKERV